MTYIEILAAAREHVMPKCKACPVCNGRSCGNAVPGPGSKPPGNAAARNYDKWQEICVNMDTLCPNVEPDISFEMFGQKFSAPIFCAPIGALELNYGNKYNDQSYNRLLMKAAYDYGILAMTGDGMDPDIMLSAVADNNEYSGYSIPTIKPWNKEAVFEKLDYIHKHFNFAVSMDIDGAGLPFLKKFNPNAGSKSVEEMREIIEYAGKPFIIKGIMTATGARKAVQAGAAGIVVSNHGGRVQSGVPSTAEVLPEIVKEVKGETVIMVDGGIRSGVDVFRALALGADAVLIGRPVVTAVFGAAEEGFRIYMDMICGELKSTMKMCGAARLKDITADKIRV